MSTEEGSGTNGARSERIDRLTEERRRLFEQLLQRGAAAGFRPPGTEDSHGQREAGAPASPFGAGVPPAGPWSPLVGMKPTGSRPPFFCVHAIFGSAFPYHLLALHLDPDQPFYGLQARGLDGAQAPIETVEEMASTYLAAIRQVQPRGPYYLGGYSFGGLIAYEMAQQLVRRDERVAVLAMLGTGAPSPAGSAMASQFSLFIKSLEDFQRLAINSAMADGVMGAGSWPWMQQLVGAWPPMARVTTANTLAALRYQPRPYPGGVELFLTEDLRQMSPGDSSLGWRACCSGRVEIHPVAGTHLGMFQEPEVRDLARKLTACLKSAGAGAEK